jgi:hypothetical protein
VTCKSTLNLTVEYHPRVFVVAEWDDSHIYHTLLGPSPSLPLPSLAHSSAEVISRIIYHREFLVSNPDLKILVISPPPPPPAHLS